jgi:hypothetical protein
MSVSRPALSTTAVPHQLNGETFGTPVLVSLEVGPERRPLPRSLRALRSRDTVPGVRLFVMKMLRC